MRTWNRRSEGEEAFGCSKLRRKKRSWRRREASRVDGTAALPTVPTAAAPSHHRRKECVQPRRRSLGDSAVWLSGEASGGGSEGVKKIERIVLCVRSDWLRRVKVKA
ncbi:hypothetical protein LR48_Vigan07g063200 [Vigna angularis]|uniref:Uncharacterized protein n=1 Tax=Phaseolus angularis TaxID=3914 RepID=A0A0L9UVZ6_PHAAN|nr:hypothetical protein LR48_Vigan07g063200 [Vigna angularis]